MSKEQRGAGLVEEPPPAASTDGASAGRARGAGQGSAGAAQAEPHGPKRGVLREYVESLVVTAVMALFGMTFVVQAVKVPTGSMQNTILVGDHLLVNKFIFAPGPTLPFLPQRDIRRGDIIVFKYPGIYDSEQFRRYSGRVVDDTAPNNIPFKTNYVKRVVGLPGERVEIRGARVLINGQPLEEHRVAALDATPDDPDTPWNEHHAPLTDERGVPLVGENAPKPPPGGGAHAVYWEPETLEAGDAPAADEGDGPYGDGEKVFDVPAGHYLVLGDNRENSQDSRFWGYVPRHLVIGRAMFVYWSFDESLPRGGGSLGFLSDFISNTRWGRTGTLIR